MTPGETNALHDLVREAWRLSVRETDRYRSRFEAVGLRIGSPKLSWFQEGSGAEVSVWIWEGTNVYDANEVFVLFEGKLVEAELLAREWNDWLEEVLEGRTRE